MTLSKRSLALLCCLVSALFTAATAYACTRAVYLGPDDRVLTGRSMDWRQEWEGNLWILPRGIERAVRAGRAVRVHGGGVALKVIEGVRWLRIDR